AAPTVACYETATWNGSTCSYDVSGTQPSAPVGLSCWETASFNTGTCVWDVSGSQPAQPTLACWETSSFNTGTCSWVVSGSQPSGTDTQVHTNSYTWIDGVTYTASNNTATFTIVGGSANGCDSLVTLNLTINTGGGSSGTEGVSINGDGSTPHASAILDVQSTSKGVLLPRVSLVSTSSSSPISGTPAVGLLVFNTATSNDVVPGFYYWNGSAWVQL
ncbi:MAG: hypothetical protein MK207_16320, partial [Saprospiraceae bacterium]|nr:hypothetical protein [Saprospiraceae bacterium]